MTNYLIRRGFQMVIVVILATITIYGLLNAVPGGPLSGLTLAADAKAAAQPGRHRPAGSHPGPQQARLPGVPHLAAG
jgi:ABC-type dipeptide/oligopeptide/nickel transport system permease component